MNICHTQKHEPCSKYQASTCDARNPGKWLCRIWIKCLNLRDNGWWTSKMLQDAEL